MLSLEEVRQVVMTTFKSVHDVYYPTMLVNYPNFVVVDLEHQIDPFITVELDFDKTPQAALGEKEINVHGTLIVYFYYRIGTGMSGAYDYTDTLNEYLGMSLIDSIKYQAVSVNNIVSFPGWEGVMNSVVFDVVKGLEC